VPGALAALTYVGALATVTVLFPTLQELGRLGSVGPSRSLAVVASGLRVVRLLRYRVTIDDHAPAHDRIAGAIAAISAGRRPERAHEASVRPSNYKPPARSICQPAGGQAQAKVGDQG